MFLLSKEAKDDLAKLTLEGVDFLTKSCIVFIDAKRASDVLVITCYDVGVVGRFVDLEQIFLRTEYDFFTNHITNFCRDNLALFGSF